MFIGHSDVFLCEACVKVFCSFFYWIVLLFLIEL